MARAEPDPSNRIVLATAEGFWQPEQADLCESYVDRYFADLPAVATRRSGARALLARDDLDPAVRRAVVDCDDELGRALAARTA